MDTNLIITFVVLGVTVILLLTEKLPSDLVALLAAISLAVTGVLTPEETFSGFSQSAVITIVAIFILAEALQKTNVTEQVGNLIIKLGGTNELRLTIVVMASGAFLSLFMNNIAAASVLLPAISGAARKASISNSRLMMPLAFGTILGGMATLLTTSNIVMNSMLNDAGVEGFSLTDFAPVGLPMAIVGILYVSFWGRKRLAKESSIDRTITPVAETGDLIETYKLEKNLFCVRVPSESILIGKPLLLSKLREDFDASVVAIEREGETIAELTPKTVIQEGDLLICEGDFEGFQKKDIQPYFEHLPRSEWNQSDLTSSDVEVVEAMLAPRSRLISETLRSSHFRERYEMVVLALWRKDEEITVDVSDVPLAFGDALLLQGPRSRLPILADDRDLILLKENEDIAGKVPGKGRASLMIFIATLIFAMAFPSLTAAIMLGGALTMILVGILTMDQAYRAIGWRSVFLITGMLPLGIALSKTNGASLIAGEVVSLLGSYGALVLLGGLIVMTLLMVQAINGAVVSAIVGPIAIQVAQQAEYDPRGFAMGVALATSLTFMTPLGHPVNILVMSTGGYNFRDFFKVGAPLTVILLIVLMLFIELIWHV